jgi:hypothetical protein
MTMVLVILLVLVFFYRSATHSLTTNWASFSDTPKVSAPPGLGRDHPVSVLPEGAYVGTNPDVRDMAVSGQVPGQLLEVATPEEPPLQPDIQSSFSGSTIALLIWPDEPVSGGNDALAWIGPVSGGGGMGVPGRTGAGNSGAGSAGSGGSAGANNGGKGSTGATGSAGAGDNGAGSTGTTGSASAGDNGTGAPGPAGAGKGGIRSTVFDDLPGTGGPGSGGVGSPGLTAPGFDVGGNTGTDSTHTQFNFGDTTDTGGTDGGDLHEDPVPAVPEPGSILLLLTAVAGTMGGRLRLVRSAPSARPHQAD